MELEEEIMKRLNLSIADKAKDIEYTSKLKNTKDKVKYLRIIKKYTQIEAANLIGISQRHIQRIERELKNGI